MKLSIETGILLFHFLAFSLISSLESASKNIVPVPKVRRVQSVRECVCSCGTSFKESTLHHYTVSLFSFHDICSSSYDYFFKASHFYVLNFSFRYSYTNLYFLFLDNFDYF